MELLFLQQLQLIHNPILDAVMVFFTTIGNVGAVWILLSIFFIFIKKYRTCGVTMLFALFLGFLCANVFLKNIAARDRPCWIDPTVLLLIPNPTDFSFPSGHTVAAFAASTALYLYQKKLGIAALVVAFIIAFSRLYLYVHFPSDVLVGMGIGILMAFLANTVCKWVIARKQRKEGKL